MGKFSFIALILILSSCNGEYCKTINRDDSIINDINITQEQYATICHKQLRRHPEYKLLSLNSFKNYMGYRYKSERLSAYLTPNDLYCGYIRNEELRKCLRVTSIGAGVGGIIEFCVNERGEVVKLRIDE